MNKPYPQCNLPIGQNGGGRKPIPVQLLSQGIVVKDFDTMAECCKWLGTSKGRASDALHKGGKIMGYDIRTNTELDKCLREIEERNRQPYKFDRI